MVYARRTSRRNMLIANTDCTLKHAAVIIYIFRHCTITINRWCLLLLLLLCTIKFILGLLIFSLLIIFFYGLASFSSTWLLITTNTGNDARVDFDSNPSKV